MKVLLSQYSHAMTERGTQSRSSILSDYVNQSGLPGPLKVQCLWSSALTEPQSVSVEGCREGDVLRRTTDVIESQ